MAKASTSENLLIVADSAHDANMLYAVGMFVPDPFIFFRIRGRCYIVMSDLEIDRARRQATHCHVIALSKLHRQSRDEGIQRPRQADVIRLFLRERKIKGSLVVPDNFPLGLANELRSKGVYVRAKTGPFFPEREQKNREEIKKISAALAMAEVGLAEGIEALRNAKIGKDGTSRFATRL